MVRVAPAWRGSPDDRPLGARRLTRGGCRSGLPLPPLLPLRRSIERSLYASLAGPPPGVKLVQTRPTPSPESRVPLSRERVLGAAVALADEEGIESLTMRELGLRLGVEAMSLYNHVANKDDILDGMVDLVVSEIDLPSDTVDWKEAMRFLLLGATRIRVPAEHDCDGNPRRHGAQWSARRVRSGCRWVLRAAGARLRRRGANRQAQPRYPRRRCRGEAAVRPARRMSHEGMSLPGTVQPRFGRRAGARA